ncbi:odorant receptor 131-2-like [Cheilinus undulatus]|uniref:odorant receptor 131-2-like n=1 Tax=Cheilinus undulatus TaxID=241271 RepID=UPI001BD36A6A|nr:odorant receptor 131-2-like [Cheilinus undulatus]
MNLSGPLDSFGDAFLKNFITFSLGIIISCINGAFVYTYFQSQEFQRDPRYVLYIHLVINDMIMLACSVVLQIVSYAIPTGFTSCCIILVIIITTNKNSPLNLAGMAVERYIAVCRPLHHVQICTVQRAHALIALIWTVSFIPAVTDVIIILATQPLSVFSQTVTCYPSNVYHTSYHVRKRLFIQVSLLSFVSLTLIVTYVKVLCTAKAMSGSNQASARNARNTILLHGVQLLICMLSYISPFVTLSLVTISPHESTKIYFTSFVLTNILPRLLSPLIYGVRDKKFSRHIRLHFCCKRFQSERKRVHAAGPRRRSAKVLH